MIILGIETSCDETAAAIVKDGREVISNTIKSQIDIHKEYGGVVPEIASRNHVMDLPIIVNKTLTDAGMTFDDIDAIAVTKGPGLVGALLIGVSYAKAISSALQKPLIGVHHIEGHIAANYINYPELKPPFLCLVVSGGHTQLVLVKDYTDYEILGKTKDDAAGEAYDKVARVIGLGYPGGPKIDKVAKEGNAEAIDFPRVMLEKDSLDFSFSGLKSAVLNYVNREKQRGNELNQADIAASFQEAVIDVLAQKTLMAAQKYGIKDIAVAGGVSANSALRERLEKVAEENDLNLYIPGLDYCTDNAAMIASMGYFDYQDQRIADSYLDATPNLKMGS